MNTTPGGGWKRWLRTAHIYYSLFGMILLLFFATTGFLMNHEDWFELPPREEPTRHGQVPRELLLEPDRLAIVELLRDDYGVVGSLARFRVENEELLLAFRKPGRTTDAAIRRADGRLQIDVETYGLLETMTHLHKGERGGAAGKLLVDFVALTMAVTALGGLLLWTTLPARRAFGVAAVATGLSFIALLWWYFVL